MRTTQLGDFEHQVAKLLDMRGCNNLICKDASGGVQQGQPESGGSGHE